MPGSIVLFKRPYPYFLPAAEMLYLEIADIGFTRLEDKDAKMPEMMI